MDTNKKWQAPGNGKIFDSKLGDNTIMNNRTIGVLKYIKNKSKKIGYVEKDIFEKEIKNYLNVEYNHIENNSISAHFYRPLIFWGFININKNKQINLTIEGNIFLTKYLKEDYNESRNFIINQLDNTKYPNDATSSVDGVYLYPFRILFKLLLENNKLSDEFIKYKLIHILNIGNLEKYIKTKNLDYIVKGREYKKFHTWVVNSLVDINILYRTKDGFYMINDEVLENVRNMYSNLSYVDMFFDSNQSDEVDEIVANKRVKRNTTYISIAKKRDGHKCVRNNNHTTFLSREISYTEGHHLLPMFQQKNFDFRIDDIDNIVSLCANCHKEVHFADDKKEIIDSLFLERKEFFERQNLDIKVLYEVYGVF